MKNISHKETDDRLVRLNKYLANAGIASRRKADRMILGGEIRVNGKVILDLGVKINPKRDKVFVNERQVALLDEPVYVVLNKPKDCIATASDERGRTTVMDYVKVRERIYSIGRLDRNTTGVLLMTNDGEFANQMMHPKFEVKKAYKVIVDQPVKPEDVKKLEEGIRLSDGKTKPAEVYVIPREKNKAIGIIIHEGRNRQIHRMFESLGYEVHKLDRISYGDITYEGLPRGRWRYLTKGEIQRLKSIAGMTE